MNKRLSTWLGALLGALAALLLTSFAHAQELTEEFHHTYPLSANGSVVIHNVNGRVKITGTDANEVKVDAIKRADSKQKLDDARIEVDSSPTHFELRTRYPEHDTWFRGYSNPAKVEYTIAVPKGARLEAGVVNSALAIANVLGEVRASDVNGELNATGLAGEAEISTVNGHAEAAFVSFPQHGRVRLHSVNGHVGLTVPSNLNADFRAHSLNGSIMTDFNLPTDRPRYGPGRRMEGKIGSGGAEIDMETVNGSIDLRHANDGKPVSSAVSTLRNSDFH